MANERIVIGERALPKIQATLLVGFDQASWAAKQAAAAAEREGRCLTEGEIALAVSRDALALALDVIMPQWRG